MGVRRSFGSSWRILRNEPKVRRFLLANTADFDPARHAVASGDMIGIDRYALALTARLQEDPAADYDRWLRGMRRLRASLLAGSR